MKYNQGKLKVNKILFTTFFLVTSSCSMINPHISLESDRPDEHPVTLQKAIDYANKGKDKYSQALGDQAKFNSYLGIGLTALGAAALGLGITGGSTVGITALGLTGASAYGIGSFLENKPRQRAYILGYNAINCAVEAVLPFNVKQSLYDGFSNSLHGDQNGLLVHIESTEKAIITLKKSGHNDAIQPEIISTAESTIETAKIAYRNGVSLDLTITNSGYMLMTSIDRIVGEVNNSIVSNQADLQSIITIIGGLGGMYSTFTTIPQNSTMAGGMTNSEQMTISAEVESMSVELSNLLVRYSELSIVTQKVTSFVNAIVDDKPLDQLKLCGIKPDDIASDIEIDPAGDIVFTQGQVGSEGRIIRGGTSPYNVSIASGSPSGLNVKQTIPFSSAFVVDITNQATVGVYSLFVIDGSGHSKYVTVRVK